MTFVFTTDEKGIAVGGGVVCHISSFWGWTPPRDRRPDAPGYVTVRCSDPNVNTEVQVDPGRGTVAALVREKPLRGGQTLTFVYGDTSDGRHPRSIRGPVASGMVQSALARVYRLGFTGSRDTHDGHPGIGSPGARAGLAGIYVTLRGLCASA
ncbi:MAG: hypothetical protein JXQ75_11930 [Phycisphaerae bacterium]|nr:hypothetical protein [Phycisphaerae bacterium]